MVIVILENVSWNKKNIGMILMTLDDVAKLSHYFQIDIGKSEKSSVWWSHTNFWRIFVNTGKLLSPPDARLVIPSSFLDQKKFINLESRYVFKEMTGNDVINREIIFI